MGLPKLRYHQKFLFVGSGDPLIVDYSQLIFLNTKGSEVE